MSLEVRDPIYGIMTFSDEEEKFIASKSFDRLRRIKQLSFSEYVYPSATHNRFNHSLGVYPSSIRKFLQWDDSRVVGKLRFLNDLPYSLVYDSDFNPRVKKIIDRRLGDYLICDTPRKSLFRKDTDDLMIYVKENVNGDFIPCTSISAI